MRWTIILLCYLFVCSAGQTQTTATLKADMQGIASDATEGRFTASDGYLKAAGYIEAQLKVAGIQPGWIEGHIGTYMQPVPFAWDNYDGSELNVHGRFYTHGAGNFIVVNRGISGRGKWVVATSADAVKGNPAGIILLPGDNESTNWETTVIRQYRFGYMHYIPDSLRPAAGIPQIMVSPQIAKLLTPGDSVDMQIRHGIDYKTGYNIVGYIPGTKGGTSTKKIIIAAHLDHIGRIGRHIYNGANDDASGCVAVLNVARLLASRPISQPLFVVFFCGEELNLKGSRWFSDHLPANADDITMSVNLEQLGSVHRSFKGVWALGDTSFKQRFYKAGFGFKTGELNYSATDSVRDILSNTDSYSFMMRNIPSVLLGSGGFDEHHTIRDKIDLIDFPHLQKAIRLIVNFIKDQY